VPPGVVASPFFSADPAVPEPCVLASFADGMELPVVVVGFVASFFIAAPPLVVVPPSIEPPVVDLLAAGPPALESPPAVLDWANDIVLASANATASPMIDLIFIVVSFQLCPWRNNRCLDISFHTVRSHRAVLMTHQRAVRRSGGMLGLKAPGRVQPPTKKKARYLPISSLPRSRSWPPVNRRPRYPLNGARFQHKFTDHLIDVR